MSLTRTHMNQGIVSKSIRVAIVDQHQECTAQHQHPAVEKETLLRQRDYGMGSQLEANNFQVPLKNEDIATNGNDFDMELENVSLAQGSSSLRYSISHTIPIGSQRHLEATLEITNLEDPTPNAKQRNPDGVERMAPINTHQGEESKTQRQTRESPSKSILSLDCGPTSPIHEPIAIERGQMPLEGKRTNYEIECLKTPLSKAAELHTL